MTLIWSRLEIKMEQSMSKSKNLGTESCRILVCERQCLDYGENSRQERPGCQKWWQTSIWPDLRRWNVHPERMVVQLPEVGMSEKGIHTPNVCVCPWGIGLRKFQRCGDKGFTSVKCSAFQRRGSCSEKQEDTRDLSYVLHLLQVAFFRACVPMRRWWKAWPRGSMSKGP